MNAKQRRKARRAREGFNYRCLVCRQMHTIKVVIHTTTGESAINPNIKLDDYAAPDRAAGIFGYA